MYGTAEYVVCKYIGKPIEAYYNEKVVNVRVLVFVREKPFKQVVSMWKIADHSLPEIDTEYHVDFEFSSFAQTHKGKYKEVKGRFGDIFSTKVEMIFCSAIKVTKVLPAKTRTFETVSEFKKRLKDEGEAKRQGLLQARKKSKAKRKDISECSLL